MLLPLAIRFTSPKRASAAAAALGALALCAMPARAAYLLDADPATLSGTAIAKDGHCNLTEAIASLNGAAPVNADCKNLGGPANIQLASKTPAPVYQLAVGTVIAISTPIFIYTVDDYRAVIESAGGTVLTVFSGCNVQLRGVTLQPKAGTQGRPLVNMGTFSGYFCTFQNGDLTSGVYGNDGGGIWNNGTINDLNYCVIKNNKAPNGSGGGIYNIRYIGPPVGVGNGLRHSAITGNLAGMGGGIYSVRAPGNDGQLTLNLSTINGNKTVANEVTGGGTSALSGGSACGASEGPDKAYDGDFNTKSCVSGTGSPSTLNPVLLSYHFGGSTKVRVQSYAITTANDNPNRDPTDWVLEALDAQGNWKSLDTRSGEIWQVKYASPGLYNRYMTKTFYFANATAYQAYRLRITKNNGSNASDNTATGTASPTNITQIAELQLFEDRKTGDGGGLFYTTHANFTNSTISRNLAGCETASCACPAGDDWCANPTGTKPTWGRGGGIFAGTYTPDNGETTPGETMAVSLTVAGNSAGQGGGFYQDRNDHWTYNYSLFANNQARTTVAKEPDFHGSPHSAGTLFTVGGSVFSQLQGLMPTYEPFVGPGGYRSGGTDPDKLIADVKLNALASEGSGSPVFVHTLKSTSPIVNAVPSAHVGDVPSEDERLLPRPVGTGYDYGAIERQATDP